MWNGVVKKETIYGTLYTCNRTLKLTNNQLLQLTHICVAIIIIFIIILIIYYEKKKHRHEWIIVVNVFNKTPNK